MDAWIWIVIAGLVLAGAIVAWALWSRARRRSLQDRFGPEYDRTVEREDSARKAAADLRERERRRERLDIRDLEPEARARYARRWEIVQSQFVDAPEDAVADADRLVIEVMRDRGYPVDDFEQRAADLSVDHPEVVESYRTAHAISSKAEEAEASTEDLRSATLAYRALFDELLDGEVDASSRKVDTG